MAYISLVIFIGLNALVSPMKSICTMEIELSDETTARNVARALELDNAGYIDTRVRGNIITARAEAENIMALRNTIDDYLACLTIASKSLENTL